MGVVRVQDYYEELGVSKTAEKAEIKSGECRAAALPAGAQASTCFRLGVEYVGSND